MMSGRGKMPTVNKIRYILVVLLVILTGTACGRKSRHTENGLGYHIKTESEESKQAKNIGEHIIFGELGGGENISGSDGLEENPYIDPEDIGDYPWVYDYEWLIIENYENFGEEWELPYVDDETFAIIKGLCGGSI